MVSPIGFGRSIPLQQAAGAAGPGSAAPASGAAPATPAAPPSATISGALEYVAELWVPIKITDSEGRRSLRGQDERLMHWYYPKLGATIAEGRPSNAALKKVAKVLTPSQLFIAIGNYNKKAATPITGDDIVRAAIKIDPEFLKRSVTLCLDNIVNSGNYGQAVDAKYYRKMLYGDEAYPHSGILTSRLRGGGKPSDVEPAVIGAMRSMNSGTTADAAADALLKGDRFKIVTTVPVAGSAAASAVPGAVGMPNAERIRDIVKMRVMADDSSEAGSARAAIREEDDAAKQVAAAEKVLKDADAAGKPAAQSALDAAKKMFVEARAKTDALIEPLIKELVTGKNAKGEDLEGESLMDSVEYPTEYSRTLDELYADAKMNLDKRNSERLHKLGLSGKIAAGTVLVGDSNYPTLGISAEYASVGRGDSVDYDFHAGVSYSRSFRLGTGSINTTSLFGPGALGKLGAGGLGLSDVTIGVASKGINNPQAGVSSYNWKALVGLNENYFYSFGPVELLLGKIKLPAEIHSVAGPKLMVETPVFAERIKFKAGAALGPQIDDLNILGGGLAFAKYGDDNKLTWMLDAGLSTEIYLDPVDEKEENPYEKKNVIAATYHMAKLFDDKGLSSHSLDVGTRLYSGRLGFGADFRLNPQLLPTSDGTDSHSSFGGSAQVSWVATPDLTLRLSGGLHSTTVTRKIIGDGSPSSGTPEDAVTTTTLGEVGIGASFTKYFGIRASYVSLPEGNGTMLNISGGF